MKENFFTRKSKALDVAYIAMSIALITVCSWISFKVQMQNYTLQLLAVLFVSGVLGWKRAVIAVSVYTLMGLIGIPVFAGFSAGPTMTTGYVVGFIFTALIVGLAVRLWGYKLYVVIPAMILGVLVCYIFGTAWFIPFFNHANAGSGKTMSVASAISICILPYLWFDAIKIAIAGILVNRLHRYIR